MEGEFFYANTSAEVNDCLKISFLNTSSGPNAVASVQFVIFSATGLNVEVNVFLFPWPVLSLLIQVKLVPFPLIFFFSDSYTCHE